MTAQPRMYRIFSHPAIQANGVLRALMVFVVWLMFSSVSKAQASPSRPPDLSKPVKVFILMGDYAMYGNGDVGPETKPGTLAHLTRRAKKYPELLTSTGAWAVRNDVRLVHITMEKEQPRIVSSDWLSVKGTNIGPEVGFGHVIGDVLDEPVLLLKTCMPFRNLGWDLLPPGSTTLEIGGKFYAGYKETPSSWEEGKPKQSVNWYAGKQYDDDVANAKSVLAKLPEHFPGAKSYEIAGFLWWNGQKDVSSPVYASRYEFNLAQLIVSLRNDFNAPHAPFVSATYGVGGWSQNELSKTLAEGQLAVANPALHPGFAGNVATVESRGFWREAAVSPRNQSYNYNGNAETTLEVGRAMGQAMTKLMGPSAK